PVLHFHGTKDSFVSFQGTLWRQPRAGRFRGVEATVRAWTEANERSVRSPSSTSTGPRTRSCRSRGRSGGSRGLAGSGASRRRCGPGPRPTSEASGPRPPLPRDQGLVRVVPGDALAAAEAWPVQGRRGDGAGLDRGQRAKRPVPVLHFHGTKDSFVSFQGTLWRQPRPGRFRGVEATV